ncbi:alanyl-tRNA editing protein [Lacrimispora brassicae]
MDKLYYNRPYVKIFEGEVLDCSQGKDGFFQVFLDRTAFYPEGGGQPADMGSLGEAAVLDVREKPEGIIHITDKPLKAGSRVVGTIDWERRFCHMQNHSGEHLLSGIVHKHYGLDNIGFHMGKDEVTVDFNGPLTQEQIEAAEIKVNEIIWLDIPVVESYPSKEELSRMDYRSKKELTGQVRLIEFPGGDVCACCGTHVMTSGEIGILKVTGMIHYKGGVRVSMVCGRLALWDYHKKQKAVSGISVLLSAKPDRVLEAVDRLKEDGLKKDGRIGQLSKELLQRKAGDYPEWDGPLLVFDRDLAPVELRQFCTMLYEGKKGSVVLACSGDEGNVQYALGSSRQDMRTLSKVLNRRLSGKGGGSTLMAQGTFQALEEDIRKAFEEEA